MNAKLMFALVLAFALTGCLPTQVDNGTVPSVTAEPATGIPTEVPPTAVPSPTPTLEPTAIPTEVPTPTNTPDPEMAIIWEIAERMLAECAGAFDSTFGPQPGYSNEAQEIYDEQLWARVSEHPEIWKEVDGGSSIVVSVIQGPSVLANDGVNPNPFANVDPWPEMLTNPEVITGETTFCEGYVLTYDGTIAENKDGDGILVGKAYLFYEVGGTQPYVLDGELKEVIFTFPPVP